MRRTPAWRVVGVLSVTETISWGVLFYAFSVVLLPMATEFDVGRGVLAGAWSLSLLVSGMAAPSVGSHIDRHGARTVMTVGSVLGAAGVWWWAGAGSVAAVYGAFALIGLASAMVLYEPAFAVVATTLHPARRATALLVLTVVAGFAATIFLPLTAALAGSFGWRDGLRWLAVLLLVATALPHWIAVPARTPPQTPAGAGPAASTADADLRSALRDGAFWWTTVAFFLGTASVTAVAAHMVAFLVDRGESAAFAAAAVGSLGAVKVGGRIVLTLAERRAGLARLMVWVFVSQGAALAFLALSTGRPAILGFVLVYGAGFGAATIARPLLVAGRWGTASYGAVAGTMVAVVTVAQAASPLLTGFARDAAGSATPVLLVLALVTVAAGLCLVPVRDR